MKTLAVVFACASDFSSVLQSLYSEKNFDLQILYDGDFPISAESQRLLIGLKELKKGSVWIDMGLRRGIGKARAKALEFLQDMEYDRMIMLDDDIFWNGEMFPYFVNKGDYKDCVWGVPTCMNLRREYRSEELTLEPLDMNVDRTEEEMQHRVMNEGMEFTATETLCVAIRKEADLKSAIDACKIIGQSPREDLIMTTCLGKGQKFDGVVYHLQTNTSGVEWMYKLDARLWENVSGNPTLAKKLATLLK